MLRRASMRLPGYRCSIVQRDNNREACFVEPENYQRYLDLWKNCAACYGIAVHACCLMNIHIRFLAARKCADSISRATGWNLKRVDGGEFGTYTFNVFGQLRQGALSTSAEC